MHWPAATVLSLEMLTKFCQNQTPALSPEKWEDGGPAGVAEEENYGLKKRTFCWWQGKREEMEGLLVLKEETVE